jgi:nitrogen fixation/metabolism regulation signal transduction histidine kinase
MIIYFLLIGFASLLVGVEFLAETQSHNLRNELLSNLKQYSEKKITEDTLLKPIDRLRSKAILMIVVVLLVMVIVLMMFIKNITEPLQHMIEVAKKISKGDLSQSIEITSNNELSELGAVINEMSSNLQEITLLSKNLCQSGENFISQTTSILSNPVIGKDEVGLLNVHLEKFKLEVEMMGSVINCFNFYTLEGNTDD